MKLKFLSLIIFASFFYSTIDCVLVINNSNHIIKIAVNDPKSTTPFFSKEGLAKSFLTKEGLAKMGTKINYFVFERDLESYNTVTLNPKQQQNLDVLIYKADELLISIDDEEMQRYLITNNDKLVDNPEENLTTIRIEDLHSKKRNGEILIYFEFDESDDSDEDSYHSSSEPENDTDKNKKTDKADHKNSKHEDDDQDDEGLSDLSSLSGEDDDIDTADDIADDAKKTSDDSEGTEDYSGGSLPLLKTKIEISDKESESDDSSDSEVDNTETEEGTSEPEIKKPIKIEKQFFTIKKMTIVLGLGIATWYMYNQLNKNFKERKNK